MKKYPFPLHELLAKLGLSRPTFKYKPSPAPEERLKSSIRFDDELRQWIQLQADHLGVSLQDFVTITMRGVMHATESPETSEIDIAVSRFYSLFHSQKIPLLDIPLFFDEGVLQAADVNNKSAIVNLISHKKNRMRLQEAFGVNESWLMGTEDKVYPEYSFYKSLSSICAELTKLKRRYVSDLRVVFYHPAGTSAQTLFDRTLPSNESIDPNDSLSSKIVIEYSEVIGGRSVIQYLHWDRSMYWDHWRSRDHMLSLIYFAEKNGIFLNAYSIYDKGTLDAITSNEHLFSHDRHKLGHRFDIDQFAWQKDDRNPFRDRLDRIKQYLVDERCQFYWDILRDPSRYQNVDAFLDFREPLQSKDDESEGR